MTAAPEKIQPLFHYADAFSRNLGWITADEQKKLRSSKVAIAGLGGVGGSHLLTLARLGVGHFHLADFDQFEIHNFNRQVGADMSSLSQAKVDVMTERALLINPDLEIKKFPKGVVTSNIDEFLDGVDIFADGFDVFSLDIRQEVFQRCREKNIPAITAGPFGMGAAILNFLPHGMSFEDYFGFMGKSEEEKFLRFIIGVSPWGLQVRSLVDRSYVNLTSKQVPSTPIGCQIASGLLATEALKIILNRAPVRAAPHGLHFDAYSCRLKRSWMPGGHKHPFFQIKLLLMKQLLNKSRT